MNLIYTRMRCQLKYSITVQILAVSITVLIAIIYYLITGDMDLIIVFE